MQINRLGRGGVLAIVALVGCGSSSGAGGTGGVGGTGSGKGGATGAFTTSVPAGTKLTDLTPAQAAQLCNDLQSYRGNSSAFLCQASSSVGPLTDAYLDLLQNPTASDSELQTVCASDVVDAGCILVDAGTYNCDPSVLPSTCVATVGDYTTCVNDRSAAFAKFDSSLPSCSTLTAASLKAIFEADGGSGLEPPEPPSCSTFYSTCDVDGGATITP